MRLPSQLEIQQTDGDIQKEKKDAERETITEKEQSKGKKRRQKKCLTKNRASGQLTLFRRIWAKRGRQRQRTTYIQPDGQRFIYNMHIYNTYRKTKIPLYI